jgi:glycerate kinase
LAQLPDGLPAPLTASSRGTGELIAAALDAGARRVVVGLGGSACTDGGAGLLQALGARVLTDQGQDIALGGAALRTASAIDLSGLHPALRDAEIVVACDVDNPLTGARGAAAVYGPQKGAGPNDVELLDTALGHWANLVAEATGEDYREAPGAGAAGGVGFGLVAVLGAVMRPGAELVFDLVGLHDALAGSDLVVTGEGSLDAQTLNGKAPAAVAVAARAKSIAVIAVAGVVHLTPEELEAAGISAAYALVDEADQPGQALTDPGPLLERIGGRIARAYLALPSAHPADEEGRS